MLFTDSSLLACNQIALTITPADLALPTFDAEHIRLTLRKDRQATRDCRVEVIMKDNHTIANDPSRVIR